MNIWFFLGCFLMLAGFLLAVLEFLAPGFGLPGIASILCFLIAVFLLAHSFEAAVTLIIIILAVLAVLLTVCLIFLNKKKRRNFVLSENLSSAPRFISQEDLSYLIGKTGVAATELRPAGIGSFDGVEFDVRADGHFVERNTPIRITRIVGGTLCVSVVKKAETE